MNNEFALSQELWAITAYFNPLVSRRRLDTYRCFRKALAVPLLTIEWHPARHFQLSENDADRLIQVGGGDWMWQKERLLQMALSALPKPVKYVAWLDCDVVFLDPHWPCQVVELLRRYPVIQPFGQVVYLDKETTRSLATETIPPFETIADQHSTLPTRLSFLHLFNAVGDDIVGLDLCQRFNRRITDADGRQAPYESAYMARPAHGHAWAARLEFLKRTRLYDRCILGSGDLFLCYGLIGKSLELIKNQESAGWRFYGGCESYQTWAAAAAENCQGRLASAAGKILHLFHGSMDHRQYKSRIDGLLNFGLDLDRDIQAEDDGPWHWTRSRDELNCYFLTYMHNRREDE